MTQLEPPRGAVSVVTPTFRRPAEIAGLIDNLAAQTHPPLELVIVDGAPPEEQETERVVAARHAAALPYALRYVRHGGGTAVQRNVGIDAAGGEFVAFIDDDIRLEPTFFATIADAFADDRTRSVGGIAGYITNQYLDINKSSRWQWYRRLRLFTTYEPGRFDVQTGYPINRYLQPPHDGLRPLDFCGSSCAVWRHEVFDDGLRFAEFFSGYGVAEDAHLALRATRRWRLLECGRARCTHLSAPGGRVNARRLAYKTAVNYRYLFIDLFPARSLAQEFRFWRVQLVDFGRVTSAALMNWTTPSWMTVLGKAEGIVAAARLTIPGGRSR